MRVEGEPIFNDTSLPVSSRIGTDDPDTPFSVRIGHLALFDQRTLQLPLDTADTFIMETDRNNLFFRMFVSSLCPAMNREIVLPVFYLHLVAVRQQQSLNGPKPQPDTQKSFIGDISTSPNSK